MPSQSLEQRISELEAKVANLIDERGSTQAKNSWWDRHFGAFKDDPDFDSAVERGAEYRRSQPNPADSPDAIQL